MEYLVVGKIINTHGIKGEVKVYPYTDNIERFSDLEVAYIGKNKIRVELQTVKYHKGFVIIKFLEFNDINEVLLFKDELLYIDDENKVILPKNHYFIFDLIDCEVVDISGKKIGYISDVLQYASNDVYTIKDRTNNKEYLIPAVKEFIKDVDISEKRIIINPIEGMIE